MLWASKNYWINGDGMKKIKFYPEIYCITQENYFPVIITNASNLAMSSF